VKTGHGFHGWDGSEKSRDGLQIDADQRRDLAAEYADDADEDIKTG
jgi:hypothetical protein